jgi:hypothetical protein
MVTLSHFTLPSAWHEREAIFPSCRETPSNVPLTLPCPAQAPAGKASHGFVQRPLVGRLSLRIIGVGGTLEWQTYAPAPTPTASVCVTSR